MDTRQTCLLYLATISFFDLRERRIPNSITFGFFSLLILKDIFTAPSKISVSLACSAFFFTVFLTAAAATKRKLDKKKKNAPDLFCSKSFHAASPRTSSDNRYPAAAKGANGILLVPLLKRRIAMKKIIPPRLAKIKEHSVLKNPEQ